MPTITRVTVSVADLTAARTLYESALGLRAKYELPGILMLAADDGVEVQLHERAPHPADDAIAITFGVADVDAATRAAIAASASIVKDPADQPWGERQAVLRDRDGHLFCLAAPLG